MTNDGPASGSACAFPFNYMGVSHTGCTTIDGDTRPWCITQTISGGDMAASGAWGYCDTTSCPVQGIDDIFIGEEGSNLGFQRQQPQSPPLQSPQLFQNQAVVTDKTFFDAIDFDKQQRNLHCSIGCSLPL